MIEINCRGCDTVHVYNPDTNSFSASSTHLTSNNLNLRSWICSKCNGCFAISVKDPVGGGIFTQFFSEGTSINQERNSMKLAKVKKLNAFQRLAYWIEERESIREKKETNKPQPWTDDEILSTYRFCNVRRMDDKVSKWLMENWYKPYFNHPQMLYAVALARFINKPESLGLITSEVFTTKVKWETIKKILRKHRDAGNVVFNGAYMVRGNDGLDKIECVVDHYAKPLKAIEDCLAYHSRESMQYMHAQITSQYGFGSFMAGQVVADLRWAVNGTWEDRMVWAPIGPGSQRGMNRLLGLDTHRSIPQKEFLVQLIGMIEALHDELPKEITDRLEAHDYQNCLCEYDKYNRALFSEGKPKQLYRSST